MSLFTYHLIEALTGHAPHETGDKTVLVTDVMSYVTRHVAQTAQAEGRAQTPVMRTSGVFPIAQLIGGAGLAKGLPAPSPIEPLPATGNTVNFNQEGQTVHGPQVNIGGDATIDHIGNKIDTGGGDYVGGNKTVHEGDVVHGDKVAGDKVGGDKISVGNISGSGIAIGSGASSTVSSGDTFTMSGNFQGANVNIKSTLKNVTQSIGALPQADAATKTDLLSLVAQLDTLLQRVPAEKAQQANEVSEGTEMLLKTAADKNPSKTMVKMLGEGLKQAAQQLVQHLPEIVGVVAKIVTAVSQ